MPFSSRFVLFLALAGSLLLISCSTSDIYTSALYKKVSYDSVKAKRFDTGKMWTFEDAPVDYYEDEYGFRPSQQWLDNVRMSALKFASWCTSSFVSQDGLILTNHHCIDFVSSSIQKEGEDIWKNGFIAEKLEDERQVPGVFVDQLVMIDDITDRIQASTKSVDEISEEIVKEYSNDTGLICKVVPLYSGGKYSLYGYRRYNDVRAVFFAASEIGLYGGDPDNFTYPRYNPDFALLRVYDEEGNPAKIYNYFKFDLNGPAVGEPIFAIGNPGTTERMNTVAQLVYKRDYLYKYTSEYLDKLLKMNYEMMDEYPERKQEFEENLLLLANSAKVYTGITKALNDPVLMARKIDFEKKFKSKVKSDSELNEKYGHLWQAIENNRKELSAITPRYNAFNISPRRAAASVLLAKNLVVAAKSGEVTPETIEAFLPIGLDEAVNNKQVKIRIETILENLGNDDPLIEDCFKGKTAEEIFEYVKTNSLLLDTLNFDKIRKMSASEILSSKDPFLMFYSRTFEEYENLTTQREEINDTEEALERELGKAFYSVFGSSIPPDATFTLRISDGVISSYDYNGTKAPEFTTFYGLYDRYYSFDKEYPWDLPEVWKNPSPDFDMSTRYNFISTNDITGGSSGSAVINKDGELVGLAFDGNIESLSGSFIYTTEANRMISVTSQAIVEILENIYNFNRISEELKTGKMTQPLESTSNITVPEVK